MQQQAAPAMTDRIVTGAKKEADVFEALLVKGFGERLDLSRLAGKRRQGTTSITRFGDAIKHSPNAGRPDGSRGRWVIEFLV